MLGETTGAFGPVVALLLYDTNAAISVSNTMKTENRPKPVDMKIDQR